MNKGRIPFNTLEDYIGEKVVVAGWINSIRDQKRMQFVILRDHTGMVQATNEKQGDELEKKISSLIPESTVVASGQVVRDERVKLHHLEIKLDELDITSYPLGQLPINEKSAIDHLLDWRHIDLRRPKNQLIFRVQTTAEHAMRSYWLDNGFIEIHSPKLMEGASESGAELFQLDYFGTKASLAQSPQFYKQMAMASGFDRVFEIGPVFRANPSFTSRHDTEFTSVDVEISYINSHKDIMEFEERWLQYVLGVVKAKHGKEIKEQFNVEVNVPEIPFPRVSIQEAYKILKKIGDYTPHQNRGDLNPEEERLLAGYIQDKFMHEFVFVTDYPANVRPFYHMRFDDRPEITKSYDLIWKGMEVTTGAQREHRFDVLSKQVLEKGVDPNTLSSYLNFFKHGCPPHGGYGFGLTRMLMNVLDAKNVREVTFLYRGPNRLTP